MVSEALSDTATCGVCFANADIKLCIVLQRLLLDCNIVSRSPINEISQRGASHYWPLTIDHPGSFSHSDRFEMALYFTTQAVKLRYLCHVVYDIFYGSERLMQKARSSKLKQPSHPVFAIPSR